MYFSLNRVWEWSVTLSWMWEQFPEEARRSQPLYSAGALKIIGPVWISRICTTDEAKLNVKQQERETLKRGGKNANQTSLLITSAINKQTSHTR